MIWHEHSDRQAQVRREMSRLPFHHWFCKQASKCLKIHLPAFNRVIQKLSWIDSEFVCGDVSPCCLFNRTGRNVQWWWSNQITVCHVWNLKYWPKNGRRCDSKWLLYFLYFTSIWPWTRSNLSASSFSAVTGRDLTTWWGWIPVYHRLRCPSMISTFGTKSDMMKNCGIWECCMCIFGRDSCTSVCEAQVILRISIWSNFERHSTGGT